MKLQFLSRESVLVAIIFLSAFIFRFVYVVQISDMPYFSNPYGHSSDHYERAGEILKGDFFGSGISFHGSAPYEYFMAAVLGVSGRSFFFLRLVQILIGSFNCILIYLLAKKLSGGRKLPAFIAGMLAALYGVFAHFEADLLMIFMTLVLVNLSLLMILRYGEKKKALFTLLAGLCLGVAALDRMNLMLFLPFGAWFIAGEFSFKPKEWKWKPALLFLAGAVAMIAPVTIRNYAVGGDFVLVAPNGGINLYIGNNPQAQGTFHLPSGSGVTNFSMRDSSTAVAERETGTKLKPSEVSDYWMKKALKFAFANPGKEFYLLLRKVFLLWNHYEIPNHLSFRFIRAKIAPVLWFMFAGFWLVAPLALVGIGLRRKRGFTGADRLFTCFLAVYMVSMLPFFITERYRQPMVGLLIAYAAVAVVEIFGMLRKRELKKAGWTAGFLAGAFIFVNLSFGILVDNSHCRIILGIKYLERAAAQPQRENIDLSNSILQLKQAAGIDPGSVDAHYNLGIAYDTAGYYSGAIKEFETTLSLDPDRLWAADVLEVTRKKHKRFGDFAKASEMPQTRIDEAVRYQVQRKYGRAIQIYNEVIESEPGHWHFTAFNNLGLLYYSRGNFEKAGEVFKRALGYQPDDLILLNNLAQTYHATGDKERARKLWERCLELAPKNKDIQNHLENLR